MVQTLKGKAAANGLEMYGTYASESCSSKSLSHLFLLGFGSKNMSGTVPVVLRWSNWPLGR